MAFNQPFPVASPLMQKPPPPPSYGPDLAVRLICPECREATPDIREEFGSGDLVCGTCGLVLGDRIVDTRSEWRVCVVSFYFLWDSIDTCYLLSHLFRRSQMTKGTILLVLVPPAIL